MTAKWNAKAASRPLAQGQLWADLSKVGNTYGFPVSILVNGNEVDRGSFVMKTIQSTALEVGGCRYPDMVVRTTLKHSNGHSINGEALLSLDTGMLLGNVAMTSDWQPKHGVFFDEVKANQFPAMPEAGQAFNEITPNFRVLLPWRCHSERCKSCIRYAAAL